MPKRLKTTESCIEKPKRRKVGQNRVENRYFSVSHFIQRLNMGGNCVKCCSSGDTDDKSKNRKERSQGVTERDHLLSDEDIGGSADKSEGEAIKDATVSDGKEKRLSEICLLNEDADGDCDESKSRKNESSKRESREIKQNVTEVILQEQDATNEISTCDETFTENPSGNINLLDVQAYSSHPDEIDCKLEKKCEVTTSENLMVDKTLSDMTELSDSMKDKKSVLPTQILENVTSLVSERCAAGDTWIENSLPPPADVNAEGDASDLLGNLFSDLQDDKSRLLKREDSASSDTDPAGRIDSEVESTEVAPNKKKKKPKVKKPRPNYFVGIQITNPEIHQGLSQVQIDVMSKVKRMKEIMNKLPTLHLTVMTLSLQDDLDMERVRQAMDECQDALKKKFLDGLPQLNFSGLGTFRNQVVFAQVEAGDGLDDLKHIHECLREKMSLQGMKSADGRDLTPHVTVMKMSKAKGNFRRTVAKKIDPELYSKFKDMDFGKQKVESLQLCAMLKPKNEVGFYQVEHEVHLGQEEVGMSHVGQSLAQSSIVSAIESLKQEAAGNTEEKEASQPSRPRKPRKREPTQKGNAEKKIVS